MTPTRTRGANPKLKDALTDQFCRAVLQLKTLDEAYRFFEDVCTIAEVKAMAQRLAIARMLFEGHTYEEVARKTGASSATISRVRRFLEYGADGYRLSLLRLGVRPGRPAPAARGKSRS